MTSIRGVQSLRVLHRACAQRPIVCSSLENGARSIYTSSKKLSSRRDNYSNSQRTNNSISDKSPHVSVSCQSPRYYSSVAELKKTPLYDLHVRHGGKMVEFGGWSMPVQYEDQSIGDSHRWVRERCGLFDVSHMVQHQFTGPRVQEYLMKLCPADLTSLPPYSSTLSVLLNEEGGIIDDLIITKHSDNAFYVVTNAANATKDYNHFTKHLTQLNANLPADSHTKHTVMHNQGLIALQGPESKHVLQNLLPSDDSLDGLHFGQSLISSIQLSPSLPAVPVHIARGGYTGEDGFEISIPGPQTDAITTALLHDPSSSVRLIGLGARDSLRLEAGMCLYGHDLDDTTTPVEAALTWLIPKSRRLDVESTPVERQFIGQGQVMNHIKNGVTRRRVGFLVDNAVPRENMEVLDKDSGEVIGRITSGCPSPTLGANIGMGYIKNGLHKSGTEIAFKIRGKTRTGKVAKMPFIQTKYWKGIAPA